MSCKLRLFLLLVCLFLVGPDILLARSVKIIRVIDGDTVLLTGRKTLRYAGINAPELHPPEGPPEPWARKAYLRNRELTLGKTLKLELAERPRDRYGRLLGYLFLPDGRLVSEILVSEGLAFACYYPGAHRYRGRLLKAQREALHQGRGLFGSLPVTAPYYIGNRRSLRFHRPDCPQASHIKRRRLFRSLREALEAGYCPARDCRPWLPRL